eukprot:3343670-Rhodomonas_salina.10
MQLPRITDQRGSVYPGSFLSLSPARVTALNVSGCHGDDAELRSRSARPRHTGVRNHGPCPQVETGQALERGGARNRNARSPGGCPPESAPPFHTPQAHARPTLLLLLLFHACRLSLSSLSRPSSPALLLTLPQTCRSRERGGGQQRARTRCLWRGRRPGKISDSIERMVACQFKALHDTAHAGTPHYITRHTPAQVKRCLVLGITTLCRHSAEQGKGCLHRLCCCRIVQDGACTSTVGRLPLSAPFIPPMT